METVKAVEENTERLENQKAQTKQTLTERIQDVQLNPALSKHSISDVPAPTVESLAATNKDTTKDPSSDHVSALPTATVSTKDEKKVSVEPNTAVKKLCEYRPPKVPSSCTSRKDKREDKEAKSRSVLGKKFPAAPTQEYTASVSCPTALPASVPEQFFSGDVPGAKYSDFIRLLAASHLGGHM